MIGRKYTCTWKSKCKLEAGCILFSIYVSVFTFTRNNRMVLRLKVHYELMIIAYIIHLPCAIEVLLDGRPSISVLYSNTSLDAYRRGPISYAPVRNCIK